MAKEIITISQARAKGLSRYFTGKPCKHGHLAEKITANGTCIICHNERLTEYRCENIERIRETDRLHRLNNLEEHRKGDRLYRQKYPERLRGADKRKYQTTDRELLRKHRRDRKARQRNAPGSHSLEQLKELFAKQHGVCAGCSVQLDSKKQLDHIFPLIDGGSNWIWNLQWLCAPCNGCKHSRHPLVWLCEIGRLSMTEQERDAKIAELANLPTDAERLAAYHAFVKKEWKDLTGESISTLGATNGR